MISEAGFASRNPWRLSHREVEPHRREVAVLRRGRERLAVPLPHVEEVPLVALQNRQRHFFGPKEPALLAPAEEVGEGLRLASHGARCALLHAQGLEVLPRLPAQRAGHARRAQRVPLGATQLVLPRAARHDSDRLWVRREFRCGREQCVSRLGGVLGG